MWCRVHSTRKKVTPLRGYTSSVTAGAATASPQGEALSEHLRHQPEGLTDEGQKSLLRKAFDKQNRGGAAAPFEALSIRRLPMKGMTRREKEVTDEKAILHILDTAQVVHLGLCVDNEPYIVPMNYGYALENGELTLYIHSSCKGKKWEMLRQNPNVFFEMECDLQSFAGDVACRYGKRHPEPQGHWFSGREQRRLFLRVHFQGSSRQNKGWCHIRSCVLRKDHSAERSLHSPHGLSR